MHFMLIRLTHQEDTMAKQHFCVVPTIAVCGYPLDCGPRFYNETTSTFADITCPVCQEWVYENRLAPGGWPKPKTWREPTDITGN